MLPSRHQFCWNSRGIIWWIFSTYLSINYNTIPLRSYTLKPHEQTQSHDSAPSRNTATKLSPSLNKLQTSILIQTNPTNHFCAHMYKSIHNNMRINIDKIIPSWGKGMEDLCWECERDSDGYGTCMSWTNMYNLDQ